MIFFHLCFGRRIQISGHIPILEFQTTFVHLPFLTLEKADTGSAACPAHPGSFDGKSHNLCSCHLWCWWSLLSEHCIRTRIMFYNVTSEYDPAFVLLILRFQLRIKMWEIHQWRKMHFSAIIPCFGNHLIFVSDFRQVLCRYLLQFSHYFSTAACASSVCIAWSSGTNLCTKLLWLSEFIPFAAMWSSWYL